MDNTPTSLPIEPEIPQAKNAGGRPSIYSQDLADNICRELAQGKSLRTVCKAEEMPDIATVFRWFRTQEGFCEQYARAKQESSDAMAEEILDISDDAISVIKGVAEKKSSAVAQAIRLRIDTRKWLMSKMKPKKYGDKVDITSDGEKLGNTIIFSDFTKKPDADNSPTTGK